MAFVSLVKRSSVGVGMRLIYARDWAVVTGLAY